MSDRLIYLPLGGAGEIGMNAYVYGHGPKGKERLIVVDLGVTFPNMDTTPGLAIQYAQGAGLTYPHAFSQGWRDPVIREYGIHRTGIPFNVLFDAKGRVAAMDLHGQPLADALELLLRRE